jgi:hypothetical protein
MRRRFRTDDEPPKSQRHKAVTLKRPNASKSVRIRTSSADGLKSTVARLTRELNEALDRQAATAEILSIVSSSPTAVQPVFDTIVRNFASLCGSVFGAIGTSQASAMPQRAPSQSGG